jgi:hypothetical protein
MQGPGQPNSIYHSCAIPFCRPHLASAMPAWRTLSLMSSITLQPRRKEGREEQSKNEARQGNKVKP